jgi:drug/metabolite transporter (DMT)-like permease
VTALWNANAFFAYIFSVKILGVPIEGRKLGAVLLATAGVLVVVYGGSQAKPLPEPSATVQAAPRMSGPLVGDLLTLTASIGYGLYQVLYKKYASFNPETPRPAARSATRPSYQRIASEADDAEASYPAAPENADAVYPPPFGLFANFLTAAVGLCTVVVLGLLVPILDWLGVEPFRAPPDLHTFGAIATIALSGVVFNAGFMASQLDAVSYHSVANDYCQYYLGPARRLGPRRHVCRRPDDDRSHPYFGRPVR